MRKLILCAAVLGSVVSASQAVLVNIKLNGHTGSNANSSFLVDYNALPKTISNAAPFLASVNGGPEFLAYCVDLGKAANTSTTYSADARSYIGDLGAVAGKIGWIYKNYGVPAADLDHQIAAQVAIWEVRYDSTFNLNTGNFDVVSLNATVKGYAQTILTALSGNPSASEDVTLYASQSNTQDVIGTVPEPASIAALTVGGLALLRRRRQSK